MRSIVVILLTFASGCAQPLREAAAVPPADGQCFNVALVQSYRAVDNDTVELDMGPGPAFEVDLSGPRCAAIDWTRHIALESTTSSWICAGNAPGQGEVRFRDYATGQSTSCHIDAVRVAPASG